MRYTHWYQCVYLVNIPKPVKYHIYAVAFPFDLRCESVTYIYTVEVIVKSHYEEVIVVITRVQGWAEDKCNNNDNLATSAVGFNWLLSHCTWFASRYAINDCWLPEDNHVIVDLVSILLTRVLGDDRFHLLRCIKRPKGKEYGWNLGVNESRLYLLLKLVWTTL